MNRKQKIFHKITIFLCALMVLTVVPETGMTNVYAQTVTTISKGTGTVICGRQAKLKVPGNYVKCKFDSSNKKIATVTSKGVVKTHRLGVVRITAKSGTKKKTFTITVKPAKASEVWLNQTILLTNQKLQLKLESQKYDTSQVKLKCSSGFTDSNGKCKGVKYTGDASLDYSYGSFHRYTTLYVCDPEQIVDEMFGIGIEWFAEDDAVEVMISLIRRN